jgi:hypothetical protein
MVEAPGGSLRQTPDIRYGSAHPNPQGYPPEPMSASTHEKKDLVITWVRQCFQAAGVEASDKEAREYSASAVKEIIEEGFLGFAEGKSVPHGTGSHTVAGGKPVPGFIAYLSRAVPPDETARLDAFDEIFERFVELTATVEAEGASGPLANAAHNRALNAANELLQQYFESTSEGFVQRLHQAFGGRDVPPVDMAKVTVGKTMGSGCAIVALTTFATAAAVMLGACWLD